MDTLKKVTGVWHGTYSYEPSDTMPKRDPVPFTLKLKQGWLGHFTGSVTEDATGGMPETGMIDGYFSFPRIEFTKRLTRRSRQQPQSRGESLAMFQAPSRRLRAQPARRRFRGKLFTRAVAWLCLSLIVRRHASFDSLQRWLQRQVGAVCVGWQRELRAARSGLTWRPARLV
jgi:hypothetical protein